jgi:DNA-binding NtrC family response regulator
MDLRIQLEDVRRRLDERPQRVQVIELGESQPVADVLPATEAEERGAVVYRPGMTMAEVEKEAIVAALTQNRGNRRKAAEMLGIGERTLYRKIKAFKLD